jgi:hypothetical protein
MQQRLDPAVKDVIGAWDNLLFDDDALLGFELVDQPRPSRRARSAQTTARGISAIGPKRHLLRRSAMTASGGEADSTSMATFGRS